MGFGGDVLGRGRAPIGRATIGETLEIPDRHGRGPGALDSCWPRFLHLSTVCLGVCVFVAVAVADAVTVAVAVAVTVAARWSWIKGEIGSLVIPSASAIILEKYSLTTIRYDMLI